LHVSVWANEVTTPTCFVVLPEKNEGGLNADQLATVNGVLNYLDNMLEHATHYITEPCKMAAALAKSVFVQKTVYLYLVDEYTHTQASCS
jgi:hypothetical protein